jgi:hypothetical protein
VEAYLYPPTAIHGLDRGFNLPSNEDHVCRISCETDPEFRVNEDLEKAGSDLVSYWHRGTRGNNMENGSTAGIRTQYVPNISSESYR